MGGTGARQFPFSVKGIQIKRVPYGHDVSLRVIEENRKGYDEKTHGRKNKNIFITSIFFFLLAKLSFDESFVGSVSSLFSIIHNITP